MLYVRVDANPTIGMGHLGRCIAICREAARAGEGATLLTASEAVVRRAREEGVPCATLDGAWDDLSSELGQVKAIVGACDEPKAMLVDTYSVTEEYVAALSEAVPVAYLGSKLFDSGHLSLVVNYSAETYPSWYAEHMPGARTCLGLAYAPLREEFWRPLPERDCPRGRVLVSTGGADSEGVGLAACSAMLAEEGLGGCAVDLVVGPLSPLLGEARALAVTSPRVSLHEGVSDMAALMDEVDGALTAAGTTLYELCARRVLSVSIAIVEEQRRDALAFDGLGAVPCAGMAYEGDVGSVAKRGASMLARMLHDGSGASVARMAELLPSSGTAALVREVMSIRRKA